MTRGRRICETIHAAVLGVWLGALGLASAAAAIVFPVMKSLDPRVPRFERYDGPHWLLAGGQVGQRVFFTLDIVQFVAVLLAGATLVLMLVRLGLPTRRWSTVLRIAFLLGLVGILSYRLGYLEPRMQDHLRQYWAAAEAGDGATAARHRDAFDAGHPLETRLLGATALLVLGSIIATAWSIANGSDPTADAPSFNSSLEEPRLARGVR